MRQMAGLVVFFWVSWSNNFRAMVLRRLGLAGEDPERWQRRLSEMLRFWRRAGRFLGVIEVDFPEEDQLKNLRGVIVAANHPSLVDAFVLLGVVPRAVCIMRSNLRRSPLFSELTLLAGYIANDQGAALVHSGIAHLAHGENLVIFPEGTRSRPEGASPFPFKRGFALMATRTGTPIQTVIVQREGLYFSKGWPLFRPARLPTKLRFRLGRRFVPAPEESADDFARRLEAYFQCETAEAVADPL